MARGWRPAAMGRFGGDLNGQIWSRPEGGWRVLEMEVWVEGRRRTQIQEPGRNGQRMDQVVVEWRKGGMEWNGWKEWNGDGNRYGMARRRGGVLTAGWWAFYVVGSRLAAWLAAGGAVGRLASVATARRAAWRSFVCRMDGAVVVLAHQGRGCRFWRDGTPDGRARGWSLLVSAGLAWFGVAALTGLLVERVFASRVPVELAAEARAVVDVGLPLHGAG